MDTLGLDKNHNFICNQWILQSCYHNIIVLQVLDTPQEVPFLSILQHLLRIDPKEPIRYWYENNYIIIMINIVLSSIWTLKRNWFFCCSDMIWDTAERLVNRSTLIENSEDAKKIMRAPSKHKSLHRLKSMDGQVKKYWIVASLLTGWIMMQIF